MNRFNIAYAKFCKKPFFIAASIVTANMLYFNRKYIQNLLHRCKEHFYPAPVIKNKLTETDEYIEKETERFLLYNGGTCTNKSENISKDFYNKDLLKDATKDEDNELEKAWRRRILMETTPRGNVYMYYDVYKLGFAYYSDVNSLPYMLLNAVAMKYCRIFKCTDFFIDQNVFTEKNNESPLIQIHHIEKKKKTSGDDVKKLSRKILQDAPFAKLKKNEGNVSTNPNSKADMVENKNIVTNKFINLGKIYNMNILNKPVKKTVAEFNSPFLDNLKEEHDLQQTAMSYKKYKADMESLTY